MKLLSSSHSEFPNKYTKVSKKERRAKFYWKSFSLLLFTWSPFWSCSWLVGGARHMGQGKKQFLGSWRHNDGWVLRGKVDSYIQSLQIREHPTILIIRQDNSLFRLLYMWLPPLLPRTNIFIENICTQVRATDDNGCILAYYQTTSIIILFSVFLQKQKHAFFV